MVDHAVVLNAGSSSLKFCVFERPVSDGWTMAARGQIEGIGTAPRLGARDGHGNVIADQSVAETVRDGRSALESLASWLRTRFGRTRLVGVGHRVVHGGLAPLHQPHNLAAIDAVSERLPGVPQVACFDTSFHRGQPAVAHVVPLPASIREAGVQRYGFHGLSYEYIASALRDVAPHVARRRVIVAHLGSGSSLCAMNDGKSVDSTFGFTALDGLCMGTRPGAVDPGVILFLFQNLGLSPKDVESLLYKKSGLLGISGLSNDMRVLLKSSDPDARLAIDYFVYRACKEIGALASVLGGIDALVFTAGIGENSAEIRRRICASCSWLGVAIDSHLNDMHGPQISHDGSRVSVWVIPTNEELMIARHTGVLLGLVPARA
jgi:acetate kinase